MIFVVSHYLFNNSKEFEDRNNYAFDEIIEEIKKNNYSTFNCLNLNRVSSKNTNNFINRCHNFI